MGKGKRNKKQRTIEAIQSIVKLAAKDQTPPEKPDLERRDDSEWGKFVDEKLREIPTKILNEAVEILQGSINPTDKEGILDCYNRLGYNWLTQTGNHHGWGTGIRNTLRTAELTDDLLPDRNWDDYYQGVVEIAVGIRNISDYVTEKKK